MRRLTFVIDVDDRDLEGSAFPTERAKVQAFVDEATEVGMSVVLLKIDGENLYDAQTASRVAFARLNDQVHDATEKEF